MTQAQYVDIGSIVIGALLMLYAPKLARSRLRGPPPKTPLGQKALTVAGEALGFVFIVGSVNLLLGASSVHDALDLLTTLGGIAYIIAFFMVVLAEFTHGVRHSWHKLRHKADGNIPG